LQRQSARLRLQSLVGEASGSQDAAVAPVSDRPFLRDFDSSLAAHLILQWAWGQMSAVEVQILAQKAFADESQLLAKLGAAAGHGSQSLKMLAKLGSNGRYPGNVHRELLNFMGAPETPQCFHASIHIVVQKPRLNVSVVQEISVPFLLPHVMFNYLFQHHRHLFDELYLGKTPGGSCQLKAFWMEVCKRKDPRVRRHPAAQREDWMDLTVPISMHGDGVPCVAVGKSGTKSFDIFSWQGIMASGRTAKVKHMIFGMFQASLAKSKDPSHGGHDTMVECWQVMMWSLNALFEGRWPNTDHLGRPYDPQSSEGQLAGQYLAPARSTGYSATVWSVKGDWDYFSKTLGLKSYSANAYCDFCEIDKVHPDSEMWPTNVNRNALWKNRLLSPEAWKAMYGDRLHPLFQACHMSNANLEPDELHVLHIGTTSYLLGSILWLLVYRRMRQSPEKKKHECDMVDDIPILYRTSDSHTVFESDITVLLHAKQAQNRISKIKRTRCGNKTSC